MLCPIDKYGGLVWGKRVLGSGERAIPEPNAPVQLASKQAASPRKDTVIASRSMTYVSAIKLIRTGTTLDLSQKAEKGMMTQSRRRALAGPPMPLLEEDPYGAVRAMLPAFPSTLAPLWAPL